MNNIAHPLPNPPPGPTKSASAFCVGTRPLWASPCRGGGFFNGKQPIIPGIWLSGMFFAGWFFSLRDSTHQSFL